MHGITSYSAYLPRHRLAHAELGRALGTRGGDGRRVVASYDEDSTTMAVEAARQLMAGSTSPPGAIYFATTTPAYLDKANAAAIHAALDVGHEGFAADLAGSARSAVAAARAASGTGGMAVSADIRTGLPTSADERDGADGAAALAVRPRPRGRDHLPGRDDGRVSRPLAPAGRGRLASVGGALRGRDVHAADPCDGRAGAWRRRRRAHRPRGRDVVTRARGRDRVEGAGRGAWASAGSATRVPPTSGCGSRRRSTGSSRGRRS